MMETRQNFMWGARLQNKSTNDVPVGSTENDKPKMSKILKRAFLIISLVFVNCYVMFAFYLISKM